MTAIIAIGTPTVPINKFSTNVASLCFIPASRKWNTDEKEHWMARLCNIFSASLFIVVVDGEGLLYSVAVIVVFRRFCKVEVDIVEITSVGIIILEECHRIGRNDDFAIVAIFEVVVVVAVVMIRSGWTMNGIMSLYLDVDISRG